MTRRVLWLLFDIAVGVLAAGLLAPVTVALFPEHYRGAWALWGVVLVAVGVVTVLRRALGIGTTGRSN